MDAITSVPTPYNEPIKGYAPDSAERETLRLSDAELATLAVMQGLLGFTSEARWLRGMPASAASAAAARLQQAAAQRCRAATGRDPGAGRRHQPMDRRRAGG
ncbi:hypothetical protein AB4305_20770 [Nocardia sp. 2YAB30]